ncbi:pyridine nucleotide-disulfide oxidoreductase, partial [Streptomyces sp. H27-D2]|nr:pyridine nucleotide-disulfide oxidoreductase [Streptomyces sp. H27-D2]
MNQPTPPADPLARPRKALVLGAGLAGMLATAALFGHFDEITVVDRDRLPESARPRKGLPQARHAHLLWSGGARAVEALLPGTMDRWLAAGARRIPLPTGLVSMSPQGWIRRGPEVQFLIACSRDLLDWVVRTQVLERPGITLLHGVETIGLLGDARRVAGARVRAAAGGGSVSDLTADLVIDATGRGSQAPKWLAELGLPTVR